MASYISSMPIWAIVLFILSFFCSLGFIASFAKKAAVNAGMPLGKAKKIQYGTFGFYVAYLAYISILSISGVFDNNAIPPSVMIFGAIPLMVLLFGIIGNSKLFKKLLRYITLEDLIKMHLFRLVGVFFIILYSYHQLPREFAFSAGIGDLITALSAFPVAWMVLKGKSWSIPTVYAWNIFGILDILTLLVIAALDVKHDIVTGGHSQLEMTIFPFVWFPAYAPVTILFLHTMIFRKLIQLKKQTPIIVLTRNTSPQ